MTNPLQYHFYCQMIEDHSCQWTEFPLFMADSQAPCDSLMVALALPQSSEAWAQKDRQVLLKFESYLFSSHSQLVDAFALGAA